MDKKDAVSVVCIFNGWDQNVLAVMQYCMSDQDIRVQKKSIMKSPESNGCKNL